MSGVLTLNETIFLAAIRCLGDDAYGVAIREKAAEIAGKVYSYGCLYCHLEQLFRKGLVNKRAGAPLPERGGRSKNFFVLSKKGEKALREAMRVQASIRAAIPAFSGENESGGRP